MMNVGDLIGQAHNLTFQCVGGTAGLVVQVEG